MSGQLQLEWQQRWVAPGVCLIGRCVVNNRGVFGAIANSMMTASGIWAFVNGSDACLLDAPFSWEDAEHVLPGIHDFVEQHQLNVTCVSASHLHVDHSAGLSCLLQAFPDATFVCPRSWQTHWQSFRLDRIKCGLQSELSKYWEEGRCKTYCGSQTVALAGEPLYFIEAPYHSATDQLVAFRGVAVLPDWHLPDTTSDELHQVNADREQIADTLRRLQKLENDDGYCIHSRIAVHGDEPLKSDFRDRLRTAGEMFRI